MKAKRLFLASLLLALTLTATACGIASVSTEGGELTITVNLSEDQTNGIIGRVISNRNTEDDFILKEVSNVDLIEPNVIRVSGTTPGGDPGSYDMTIAAANDVVQLEVIAVDAPGITLDDPRVQAANDELAQAFLESANSSGDGGGVADVAVVNDELVFTIKAPLN